MSTDQTLPKPTVIDTRPDLALEDENDTAATLSKPQLLTHTFDALNSCLRNRITPMGFGAAQLRQAGLAPLVQLGQTLASWSEEIVAMWRFTRNNGITEGFHNKMELINRQAYGFRNFQNYRLRVKVLC